MNYKISNNRKCLTVFPEHKALLINLKITGTQKFQQLNHRAELTHIPKLYIHTNDDHHYLFL